MDLPQIQNLIFVRRDQGHDYFQNPAFIEWRDAFPQVSQESEEQLWERWDRYLASNPPPDEYISVRRPPPVYTEEDDKNYFD